MKHLILLAIRVYWIIPRAWRKRCIFKCSCSHYVFEQTLKEGAKAGWNAFQIRRRRCRPGYGLYTTPDGVTWVILADKSVVDIKETNINGINL